MLCQDTVYAHKQEGDVQVLLILFPMFTSLSPQVFFYSKYTVILSVTTFQNVMKALTMQLEKGRYQMETV